MSSEKKDRYKKTHGSSSGSSPKGHHHHKASDSGVAQDYQQQAQNPRALREALDNSRFELGQWKEKYKVLEADLHVAESDRRSLDATYRALSQRNTLLEQDQKALHEEIHSLKTNLALKAEEANQLREDLRRFRKSPSQEPNVSVPLGHSILRSSPDPKPPRAEGSRKDKHREEKERQREEKARHAEDKERLRSRFDTKDEKGPSSSHSGQSGHSAHSARSGHSGRSRRASYVEPFGPGARPALTESVAQGSRSGRDYKTYSSSSTRPPLVTSISTPRSAQVPTAYSTAYNESVFYDSEYEPGDYQAHPLPETKHKSRR